MRAPLASLLAVLFLAPGLPADAQLAEDAPPAASIGRGDPGLVEAIRPILAEKAIAGARVSILVERADGGPPLYAVNPDLRLHPASNTKLVTTAAAFEMLGPSWRWRTDLAAAGYADGKAGTLYLIGGGDPRFVSESLWKLVDDARDGGLVEVSGDLVVDDDYFTADRMAPGFDDKDQDSAYRAASSAASLNFNAVVISVAPGAKAGEKPTVRIRPDSGYVIVENRATTAGSGRERLTVSARAEGDRTKVVVGGRIPVRHRGVRVRRRIDDPSLYAGMAAKLFLERAGIPVKGEVKRGSAPKKRRRLARVYSVSLASAAGDVNKLSNNMMAETLLRTIGRVKGGSGGWDAGTRVVSEWLREAVGLRDGFRYVNGSGLFGETAFSARDMVSVLRHMHRRRPAMPEYAASLAIGSTDGTLRRRMKALQKLGVRAKTGTLDGVVCLSGYLTFADGTPGAFSILINDFPGAAWRIWGIQDRIVEAAAGLSPGPAPRR